MRKIKIILYSLIMAVVILLFSGIIREFDESYIAGNPTIIEVIDLDNHKKVNLDKRYPKSEFFTQMQNFAHKEHISLVRTRFNNINGHQSKIVYDLGTKNNDFSLYRNRPVKRLTNSQLQLESLYSTYCTNAKGKKLKHLISEFHFWDITVRVSDNSLAPKTLFTIILNDLSKTNLVILLGIIGILFIIMVLDKVYRFKAYAVMKLHGFSLRQIIKSDIKDEALPLSLAFGLIITATIIWSLTAFNSSGLGIFWPYMLAILLIVLLALFALNTISYIVLILIKPYEAIKGAANTRSFLIIGYILKVLLLGLIVINTVSLANQQKHYEHDTELIRQMQTRPDTYSLGLQWNFTNRSEDNKVARLVHRVVVHSPSVIIERNAQAFHPAPRSTGLDDYGNIILANNRFIKQSSLKPWQKQLDQHKLVMFVPRNRLDQVKRAKKQLIDFIKFQHTLPNIYHQKQIPAVKIVPVPSGLKVLNYNNMIYVGLSAVISTNPLVVAVNNNKLLSDNFYLAFNSQEMIQFQDLKSLKKVVKKVGLMPYFSSFTSMRATLTEYITNAQKQLLLITITTILSLLQLLFIVAFVSSTFLQGQRHKLAVRQVFGKSNAKIVGSFLAVNLLIDLVLILIVLRGLRHLELIPFALGYLLLETLIILLTYQHAQRNLLTTLNHGN